VDWTCWACSETNPEGTRYCGHCGQARQTDAGEGLSDAAVSESIAEVASLLRRSASSPEERRLVTVLFADIAGFTALADRLDPERLVEVIDPVLAAMGRVVTAFGGHVSKYAGDAILAFFGAPQAHEDDAIRALLAAREMSQEVERLATERPEALPLALHIGVNTGHVVTGYRGGEHRLDYSVLGDAVNVAQRLEAASATGEVYVGELTFLLSREAFRFEEVGELTLKGKPEPVRAWRLVAEARADTRRAVGAMVGRERERALLGKLVAGVAAGEARLLALVGEPGVGKSRLLEALREEAEAAGLRWSQLRCRSYGTGAYGPYLELIRELAGILPDDPPDVAAARIADAADDAAAAPYLQHVLGIGDHKAIPRGVLNSPEALRHRVHEALVDFLTARAAQSPLVIAIEDAHWMDAASVDLSTLLGERAVRLPVLAAVTTRAEGRGTIDRLTAAFGARADVVELARLDRVATEALVRDILGAADEQLLELVESRTAGNPLFVQEVVRSLLDADALVHGPHGWHVEAREAAAAVPTTVESVLAARIDLLPRDAAELLQVASVIGPDVPLRLLREMADTDAAALEELVDVLVERELLDRADDGSGPRLLFHHALVVDVAYGRMLRRRRREIHRRVVETALRLHGSGDDVIDLLAHHAMSGEMGAEAVTYLEQAGRRAARLFANDDSVVHLRHAIEIAETEASSSVELAQLVLELARVEELTGAYDSALGLYERAQSLTDELAGYLGVASTLRKLGRYDDCLRVLDQARSAHPEATPTETAALALQEGWVLALRGDISSAADVLAAGLEAVVGRDQQLEGQLRVQLGRALAIFDRSDEALTHAERARLLFEEAEDLTQLPMTLRVLGGIQHDVAGDDVDAQRRALGTLQQGLALARRVGNAEEAAAALINIAVTLADLEEVEAAIDADRQALAAFGSVGLKAGVACAYCNLADHLARLDRYAEALEAAEEGFAVAAEIGNPYWITGALYGIAENEHKLGNHERAAAVAEDATDRSLAHGYTDRARSALGVAIEAHEALANAERVEALRVRAAALAEC